MITEGERRCPKGAEWVLGGRAGMPFYGSVRALGTLVALMGSEDLSTHPPAAVCMWRCRGGVPLRVRSVPPGDGLGNRMASSCVCLALG